MKSRMLLSMLIIALVAAVIGGATMASFTAKVDVENEFTAGTVMITADEDVDATDDLGNVNPGDCLRKVIDICNTGSKAILLRLQLEGTWTFDEQWLSENWEALCFSDEPIPVTEIGWATFFEGLVDPASFDLGAGWFYYEGWWYYTGDPADAEACIKLDFEVCFDLEDMGNHYQKATYELNTYIQAIQASNNASGLTWGVDSLYDPEEVQSAQNWTGFDFPAL